MYEEGGGGGEGRPYPEVLLLIPAQDAPLRPNEISNINQLILFFFFFFVYFDNRSGDDTDGQFFG